MGHDCGNRPSRRRPSSMRHRIIPIVLAGTMAAGGYRRQRLATGAEPCADTAAARQRSERPPPTTVAATDDGRCAIDAEAYYLDYQSPGGRRRPQCPPRRPCRRRWRPERGGQRRGGDRRGVSARRARTARRAGRRSTTTCSSTPATRRGSSHRRRPGIDVRASTSTPARTGSPAAFLDRGLPPRGRLDPARGVDQRLRLRGPTGDRRRRARRRRSTRAVLVDRGRRPGARAGRRSRRVNSTADERPAANITFVIDTSGSMDIRERLGLVQGVAGPAGQEPAGRRHDRDRHLRRRSPRRCCARHRSASGRTIVDAIDELQPGGSTNMEDGLRLGYEQARRSLRPRRRQRGGAGVRRRRQRRDHRPRRADRARSPRPATTASTS